MALLPEGVVGPCGNNLALRAMFGDDPTFRCVLGRAREATAAAFANQDLPFERLVDALGLSRDLARAPPFQALFVRLVPF